MKSYSIAAAILGLVVSQSASASFLEACELTTEVTSIARVPTLNGNNVVVPGKEDTFTRLATLKILAVVDKGGHTNCTHLIDKSKQLVIDNSEKLEIGQKLEIDYRYVNGMAPNGIYENEKWSVK